MFFKPVITSAFQLFFLHLDAPAEIELPLCLAVHEAWKEEKVAIISLRTRLPFDISMPITCETNERKYMQLMLMKYGDDAMLAIRTWAHSSMPTHVLNRCTGPVPLCPPIASAHVIVLLHHDKVNDIQQIQQHSKCGVKSQCWNGIILHEKMFGLHVPYDMRLI